MAKTDKTSNIYIDGKQAGNTIKDLRTASRKLNNEINQLAPGTDKYRRKVAELGKVNGRLTDHRNEIKKVSGSYNNVRKAMGGVQNMVKGFLGAGAIIGAVRGIVGGIGNWVKTNAQLSSSLSSLRSITGASTEDIKFYKAEAIQMGKDTTQSATQVIDAMKLIGSAKPELLGNKQALADVTKETITLAEAAEMEMKPAADALTGALNQWGQGADQANRFTNVLAAGSKAGSANIESLSQSIDKSGAVMAGYNINIEQGVGLLETMAERNLKGAEAGTQLRNVMLKMQGVDALPNKAIAQLEKYGVNTDIVKDKTQPLNDRLAEMAKISGDATAMMQVFGTENIVAAGAILENTDKVEKYTAAVEGTNTAAEQAAINNDNWEGDLKSLDSAWEGLTLTVGGAEGVMRSFTQGLTREINLVTDSITAFKEWDKLKMENVFLRWADELWVFGGTIQDVIDEKLRMSNIINGVVDAIEDETRSNNILTASLIENKTALMAGNQSEAEKKGLIEENEKIIKRLNEAYPELTKNIDLQNASNEELIDFQEQANQAILDSAIAEAKAEEQKRLLNKILEDSIKLRRQEKVEAERGMLATAFAFVTFQESAKDVQGDIDTSSEHLRSLDETFQGVEQSVRSLGLTFTEDFEISNEIIDETKGRIQELQQQMNEASSGNAIDNAILQAKYNAEIKILKKHEDRKQKLKDEQTEANEEKDKVAAEKRIEQAKKTAEKKAKEEKKALEDMRKELEDLAEFEKELNEQKNRDIQLAAKEGLDREIQEAENAVADKYKKEIEAATRLAKQKGDIGAQGAERLASLELLQEEELENKKQQLRDKYNEINEAKLKEETKRQAEIKIQVEDAHWQTRMALAHMNLDEAGDLEVAKRRDALDEIQRLEEEKANAEWTRKKQQLELEFEDKLITEEDQKILLEEAETEHLARMTEIKAEAAEKDKEIIREQINTALNLAQEGVNVVKEFYAAHIEARMEQVDRETRHRIKQLDRALQHGEISEEQYDRRKATIDENANERKKKLRIEQFEQEKKISLVEAAIKTAMAVMQALAGSPPPASYILAAAAGALGGIQIAAINSQEPPQFAEGGFTQVKGAQDGRSYNARIKGKARAGMMPGGPQMVLVNERGPEYFIPNPLLEHPEVIDHVRAIDNIRVRQFAEGGATDQMPASAPKDIESAMDNQLLNSILMHLELGNDINSQLLELLPDLRVIIGDDKIVELQDRMEALDNIRA